MMRTDILERLQIDPGQVTLGQLLQDREAAANEIERLRTEVGHLRVATTMRRGERVTTTSQLNSEKDSKETQFRPGALISIKEVCRLLGISRTSVYMKLVKGVFPKPVQLGPRTVRWRTEAIEAWVEARATTATIVNSAGFGRTNRKRP